MLFLGCKLLKDAVKLAIETKDLEHELAESLLCLIKVAISVWLLYCDSKSILTFHKYNT